MEYYYDQDAKDGQQLLPLDGELFRLVEAMVQQEPTKYENRVAWMLDLLHDHPCVLFAHPDASYLEGNSSNTSFDSISTPMDINQELTDLAEGTTKSFYLVLTKMKMYGHTVSLRLVWVEKHTIDRVLRMQLIDSILEDLK